MSFNKGKEEVRDGFLGDLPAEIRDKVLNVHKIVSEIARSTFNSKKYFYLNNQQWAKTMMDEFLTVPTDKSQVGSVRLYKKGKRYKCMIQLTAHVSNNRNTEDEEFFHGLIRNIHHAARSKVRKKFDMTLSCESEHGEPFEGFDLWTKQKVAKELWELFEDKKTKAIKPMKESVEENHSTKMVVSLEELPVNLQRYIESANDFISTKLSKMIPNNEFKECVSGYTDESSEIGYTVLENTSGYKGSIIITPEFQFENATPEFIELVQDVFGTVLEESCDYFESMDSTKLLYLQGYDASLYFEFQLVPEYAEKLWNYLESHDEESQKVYPKNKKEIVIEELAWDPFMEADNTPEYNVDMSESQAKRTLRTISQEIINKKDLNQYTADIYSNIITKNLLPLWSKGYKKFHISLNLNKSAQPTVEFRTPKIGLDFVSRFINGRETIDGLLHRTPSIELRMSPKVFLTMKDPDDAYNFFKAAIKYYDSGIKNYSTKLMAEVMKMGRELKHLVSTTKLSGIVVAPMKMLFVFDDVDMSDKSLFKISSDDIKTINRFVRNIYTNYASPEKEKKKIVEDLQKTIMALREYCESTDDTQTLRTLPQALQEYYDGKMDQQIKEIKEQFILEQVDANWSINNPNKEIRLLQESTKMKKLKKIPSDLVAYITIETESIRDANDKMMIASYCISKIEIVEWYIELLTVGSKKYIVPHSKPQLERIRLELLACYKRIMETPIPNNNKPLIDRSGYPAGYEG